MRSFLGGDEALGERRPLRLHLATCAECDEHYRAGVETLARFAGRGWRPSASRRSPSKPGRRRMSASRMLLPAFGLCALWAIAGRGSTGARVDVVALDGHVRIGGEALAVGETRELVRGRTCSTGDDGRATLTAAGASLVLGPASDLLIERAAPLRVRLFAGSLGYEGTLVVVGTRGVVETENGSGTVRAGADELVVSCTSGEARRIDGSGVRSILPGSETSAAPR